MPSADPSSPAHGGGGASRKFVLFGRFVDYIYLAIGPAVSGMAGAVFYTPARITAGGATGIGTIFYYLFGLDQGAVMMCVNIPLILIGMKVFGWRYGIKTLIGSTLVSFWTSFFGGLTGYNGILDYSDNINILLSAIYGGVLMGIGIGITMRSGCNTGGTDIVSQVISHYFPVSVGSVSFSINAVVVSCGGIFLGLQPMLLAIIAMYLSAQMVNFVVMNFGTKLAKSVFILSDEHTPEISRRVISELHHGGTAFHGTGIYTSRARTMLLVVVPNHQINILLKIIHQEDPKAFVFVTEAYEVLGRGFVPLKKAAEKE